MGQYAVGDKVSFTVREAKSEGGNIYFIIHPEGYDQDIKAFDFQRGKVPPFTIDCYCRAIKDNGEPVFMQDIAKVLPQLYTVGQAYDFRVKNDVSGAGYYEVIDSNGLVCRLSDYGRARLHLNQVVTCQVTDINLVRMKLKLVSEKTDRGIPFYDYAKVLELSGPEADRRTRWALRRLFERQPVFTEALQQYRSGNPLWLMTALDVADRYLAEWLTGEPKLGQPLLERLHKGCLTLLEHSDYLRNSTEAERVEYQDKLSKCITHVHDYMEAVELKESKKYTAYVADLLDRLKTSGCLYQPERKMRVAMAIFTLKGKTVTHFIREIFDIIQARHADRRFMHLFSKAFIEMLDVYIANESKTVDLYATAAGRNDVYPIIRALAMRLLLTQGDRAAMAEDTYLLYRSMLYRYSTLVANVNLGMLLQKARLALLGFVPDKLEFGWLDLQILPMMCNKIAAQPLKQTTTEARMFEGAGAVVKLDGQRMSLMPLQRGENLQAVADRTLFDNLSIRVLLNERLAERAAPGTRQITQYHRMWNEIEKSLFSIKQNLRPAVTRLRQAPELGDEVTVRVLHNAPGDKHTFVCRIEDDNYAGEALLSPKQIVPYNVIASPEDFRDPDSGEPYLLRGIAASREPGGQLRLNMRPLVADFLKAEIRVGDQILVQLSREEDFRWLAITSEGFTVNLPKSTMPAGKMRFGEFLWTQIDKVMPNGFVDVSYVGRAGIDDHFQIHDAFRDLLYGYAQGKTYKGAGADDEDPDMGDAKSAESFLAPEFMRELIHIIDREALMHRDHIVTYNLLAVARILSRLLADSVGVAYFTNRMALVEAIRLFGDNGRIEDEKLDKLLKENEEFVKAYPDIRSKLAQLKAVNLLDKDTDWQFLFAVANEQDDAYRKARDIARYVLAYNLLKDANQFEARRSIMRKIYQVMELAVKLPENNFVANEDQFTELKTSIIYPADRSAHMMANEKAQMAEILKVVCSLLNSRGGRLYVGVNDFGDAVGLHNDFTYLNSGHRDYELTSIKDKFDRKVRDAIHNQLGRVANSLVEGAFETVGDMTIYRLDASPSAEVIMLDGVAYERQGSSKWPIDKAKLAQFIEDRKKIAAV